MVSDFGPDYGATELEGMTADPGQDALRMIQDAAERLDLWIYVDGDGKWRIRKRPEYVGATALKLTTGASGTILDANTVLTRGDVEGSGFHNAVTLKYSWTSRLGKRTGYLR